MQLAGRLVGNAIQRETKTGQKVTAFTVAMNDQFKKKDGTKVKNTTFIECAVWNRPLLTDYLTQGLVVELVGFPSARAYTDGNGELKTQIQLRVDKLTFLGSGKSAPKERDQPDMSEQKVDEDLPF